MTSHLLPHQQFSDIRGFTNLAAE